VEASLARAGLSPVEWHHGAAGTPVGHAIVGFVAICAFLVWPTRRLLRSAVASHRSIYPAGAVDPHA